MGSEQKTIELLKKAEAVHGVGRFCYDLVKYIRSIDKVDIICPTHGIFTQQAGSHLMGAGCMRCGGRSPKTHEEYFDQVQELHKGKIYVAEDYKGDSIKSEHVCTICDCHWQATPTNVLRGHGCWVCGQKTSHLAQTKSNKEYLQDLKIRVEGDIIAIESYRGARTPIEHLCTSCDNTWAATPDNILRGKGCPACSESYGEKAIRRFLKNEQIEYEPQKKFDGCKDQNHLPFDFYLPSQQICIEYDGEQHFKPISFLGGEAKFRSVLAHEIIKDNFCRDSNIQIIRIPHYCLNRIDSILASILLP